MIEPNTSTVENSIHWKLWHGVNYMIGGITFFIGSYMYYPSVNISLNGYVIGAWLFTVGSFCFLLADLTEWNHFRNGCLPLSGSEGLSNKFKEAELGLNFFCSAIGSFIYLIGSIFFIPSLDMLVPGEYSFIYGSIVIFLSQSWKCWRTMFCGEDNEIKFIKSNIMEDFSGFNIDVHAGLGGFCYAIGTYLFKNMQNDNDQISATNWFMAGGFFFSLSGFFMQYRYFFEKKNIVTLEITPKNRI